MGLTVSFDGDAPSHCRRSADVDHSLTNSPVSLITTKIRSKRTVEHARARCCTPQVSQFIKKYQLLRAHSKIRRNRKIRAFFHIDAPFLMSMAWIQRRIEFLIALEQAFSNYGKERSAVRLRSSDAERERNVRILRIRERSSVSTSDNARKAWPEKLRGKSIGFCVL